MSKLNRALAATDLVANIYYNDGVEAVQNDFDIRKPWSAITEETDSDGNVWIKIPKFYTKYVIENGIIKERYISEFNGGTGWHLNPIFKNSKGKEIDYFYVSKYLLTSESGKLYSKSGLTPYTSVTAATVRALVNNYEAGDTNGYEYGVFDIWALIALQDLCLIEFATSDVTSIMYGRTYSTPLSVTGTLDAIGTATASASAANRDSNDTGSYTMKYRGIENLWGNGRTFIDGIFVQNGKLYYQTNNYKYGTYNDYEVSTISAAENKGVVHQLAFDQNSCLVFPTINTTGNGSYGDYGDEIGKITARNLLYIGMSSVAGKHGLFSFTAAPVSSALTGSTFRMIKKPE